MAERVLVVDDAPVARRLVETILGRSGYEAVTAEGGALALAILTGGKTRIDCVVLDLVMPDLDGLGVLASMREAGVNVPVIVQTAHGGIDNVVSAMRAGAVDFVVKPVGAERLQVSLRNALATRALEGESGVGKELIARAIHGSGERRAKPFVAVNCGAIPENLVESVLFGHEKGAFTGAAERHAGKFVEASGGTLFLDEIGELPLGAQVKLLRALQEGEIDPVGAKKPVRVDVRIISATNRDLIAEVRAGRFREDLYYRLCVFPISVPPLRERAEDIPHLVRHFLLRFSAEEGKRVRGVSAQALAMLMGFSWPGNVRQLENAIFRAVVLVEADEIGIDEFPQIAALNADVSDTPLVPRLDVDVRTERPSGGLPPLGLDTVASLAPPPSVS